ncbi:MAG: hypothetical protein KY393_01455, partial [Actinobacteria bacterium]|nr:hypothetical protein [Actinomycetota bacterium]
ALFADMKMPYTEALLQSIPKIEDRSHTRLNAIPGRPPDLVNPPKGCPFSPRCPNVRETCHHEAPPLIPAADDPTHFYACWYPVGSPAYLERKAERLQARVEKLTRQLAETEQLLELEKRRRPRTGGVLVRMSDVAGLLEGLEKQRQT